MPFPETISLASLPLLIMGGLLLWSGIFFTGFASYLPRGSVGTKDYLCFGLASLASAFFSFAGAAAFSMATLQGRYFWSCFQFLFSIPLVLFFILFSAHHLQIKNLYFNRIFPLITLAFIPLFLKPQWFLKYEVLINQIELFGSSFEQFRVPPAPLGAIFIVWAFVNAAIVGIYWVGYLRIHRDEWSLMLGFALFVAAGVYDALASFEIIQGPNLFIYGFSALLAAMAIQLFHNVNRANERYRQKTRDLEQAHEEIQFLVSSISHDILSPLVSIHGFADLLEEEGVKESKNLKNYLDRIRVNADHMKALLNDLAAYLKMGHIDGEQRRIHWPGLIQEALVLLDLPRHYPQGQVEVTKNWPEFWASPKRLKQLIINLVQNSFKYAGREDVRVHISCEPQGEGIVLRVKDNGPGIPEAIREKVFEAFFRHQPHTPGTGMGLAIVKRIAQSMGGRAWVEEGSAQGSTVAVYLQSPKHP